MAVTPNHDPVAAVIRAQWDAGQRGILALWTIYDRPKDHPEGFIARRFDLRLGVTTATEETIVGDLEALREVFHDAGLIRMTRDRDDDSRIVESWI